METTFRTGIESVLVAMEGLVSYNLHLPPVAADDI